MNSFALFSMKEFSNSFAIGFFYGKQLRRFSSIHCTYEQREGSTFLERSLFWYSTSKSQYCDTDFTVTKTRSARGRWAVGKSVGYGGLRSERDEHIFESSGGKHNGK